MLPPSATVGEAVSVTVVVSTVSVTSVTAGAGLRTSDSKLPPLAEVMLSETEPVSTSASSPGAASVSVPVVAPVAMVICWPFDRLTVTGDCAALVSVAV